MRIFFENRYIYSELLSFETNPQQPFNYFIQNFHRILFLMCMVSNEIRLYSWICMEPLCIRPNLPKPHKTPILACWLRKRRNEGQTQLDPIQSQCLPDPLTFGIRVNFKTRQEEVKRGIQTPGGGNDIQSKEKQKSISLYSLN